MIKQKYTPEFKQGAIEWVEQQGLSCAEAGQRLGIPAGNVSRWIREARREQSQMNGCGTTVKEMQARLRALEKENRRLQMEREILKKAAAFFAKEST
jgi:transposase